MRLKAARRAAGLSMGDCAAVLGVQWQQYAKYEQGRNRLTGGMILALADLLQIPVGRLFEPDTGRPLDDATSLALRLAGKARGVSAAEISRRLVEAAARDGLIDAILDDDVRTAPNRRFQEAA